MPEQQPNIILVMADDLGYGDVGYYGNAVLRTPELDAMAAEAVRLDRFYAAAPVCSPTRGSCITGRHPYRYGILWAGEFPLPAGEVTLAQALGKAGYATGHFGKWHMGSLSRTVKQTEFPGPVDPANYSPPWERGFDECFSTASMMPTYNPYYHVGGAFGSDDYRHVQTEPVARGQRVGGHRWRDYYWTGPGQFVDEWLEGDDAEIIMDRALGFIERQTAADRPFLSLIWFHTPHTPVVAGDDDRALYAEQLIEGQHWFGAITAMDRQIGRLRCELRRLGIADDTIVWFCSDNGPSYVHNWNSAGPLRGGKATLWEGGIRVPAIVEWPSRLAARAVSAPLGTVDFHPTLLATVGVDVPGQPQLDGLDVMPLLTGGRDTRGEPMAFQSLNNNPDRPALEGKTMQYAMSDERWKLLSRDDGATWQLYDLDTDIGESTDIAADHSEAVADLRARLDEWLTSCAASARGEDYGETRGASACP